MTDRTIEIGDWGELEGLVAEMREVGEQMSSTTAYAVGWMCRSDGFATSPACLLRPLGELMELVGDAFAELGRAWSDDWERVVDATVVSTHGLRASDLSGADRFHRGLDRVVA